MSKGHSHAVRATFTGYSKQDVNVVARAERGRFTFFTDGNGDLTPTMEGAFKKRGNTLLESTDGKDVFN
jgi:hypothetical protein